MTYTRAEVCRHLKINRQTFYKLAKEGLLQSFRIGRDYRVTEAALQEFMGRSAGAAIVTPPPART